MAPSGLPSGRPSAAPTVRPSYLPSVAPSSTPSLRPTGAPTTIPTAVPTFAPFIKSLFPTALPSGSPTYRQPTQAPSVAPSTVFIPPSSYPTLLPSVAPTLLGNLTCCSNETTLNETLGIISGQQHVTTPFIHQVHPDVVVVCTGDECGSAAQHEQHQHSNISCTNVTRVAGIRGARAYAKHSYTSLTGKQGEWTRPFEMFFLGNSSTPEAGTAKPDQLVPPAYVLDSSSLLMQANATPFVPAANRVSFGLRVSHTLFRSTSTYIAPLRFPASVSLVLKTADVHYYGGSTLERIRGTGSGNAIAVGFQLRDAHGGAAVRLNPDEVSIYLEVFRADVATVASGSGSPIMSALANVTARCPTPVAYSGIGGCMLHVPASWFSASSATNVTVRMLVVNRMSKLNVTTGQAVHATQVIESSLHRATLHRMPPSITLPEDSHSASSEQFAYTVAALPKHPLHVGDLVQVFISTNANSTSINSTATDYGANQPLSRLLHRFQVMLSFDTDLLWLVNASVAAKFSDPAQLNVSVDAVRGHVWLSGSRVFGQPDDYSTYCGTGAPSGCSNSGGEMDAYGSTESIYGMRGGSFLARLCFRVAHNATAARHERSMELLTHSLRNSFGNTITSVIGSGSPSTAAERPTLGFFDDDVAGFNHTNGVLNVHRTGYAGLLSYTAHNELVNTAALTGLPVTSSIVTFGVPNRHIWSVPADDTLLQCDCSRCAATQQLSATELNQFVDVTRFAGCSSPQYAATIGDPFSVPDPTKYVADIRSPELQTGPHESGCVLTVHEHHTSGMGNLPVTVSLGNLTTTVPYRIYKAASARVVPKDSLLNRIM